MERGRCVEGGPRKVSRITCYAITIGAADRFGYQVPLLNPGNPISLVHRGAPDVATAASAIYQWQNGKLAAGLLHSPPALSDLRAGRGWLMLVR